MRANGKVDTLVGGFRLTRRESLQALKRAGAVLLIAWLSLELHELGHLVIYWLSGHGAWLSFQRVHPLGDPTEQVQLWAKLGGPLVTLVLGASLLRVARARRSFAWVTASFVNASFRIFPCGIAIVRAASGARSGFSDEGDIVFALTQSAALRVGLLSLALMLSVWLTVLAAKEYRFQSRALLKSVVLYALAFSVGFIAFQLDALFAFDK